MANYEIPENPEFSSEIRKFEVTDPAHADLLNDVIQALVNNEVFLKKYLDLKATIESPCFTGTPIAPTAESGTNSAQIATTAFVLAAVSENIAEIIDDAPETMNTLKEVANAIAENQNVADALNAAIGTKVDKVSGKGLSTNDYTTTEKTKLAGIASGANKTIVDSAMSSTSTNPVQNKVVSEVLSNKSDTDHTHDVSSGGTGATTAKGARANLMEDITNGISDIIDSDSFMFAYMYPNESNGGVYIKKATYIWEYIKSKISSVLGLSKTSYGGNSATATKATQDSNGNVIIDTYASKANPVFTDSISMNRLEGSIVGEYSTALGYYVTADGYISHAEGQETSASGGCSHAEGFRTATSGESSHAEGEYTVASGYASHAEGEHTVASGYTSHAEGLITSASGKYSHAEGTSTTALQNQHAQGHYNDTSLATENSVSGISTGTAFVIGNGTSSAKSNAFRITGDGAAYAKAAYNSTGADYAEYAEWADENPNNEDRRGYFVTFDEEKPEMIRIANAGDYILGIVSGNPCIIGNADEGWLGKYVFDDFGTIVYEEVEEEVEYIDKETGETKTKTELVTTYKLNPDFDPAQQYIHRKDRQEWAAIGWIGVLPVRDDGTCTPGGYCTVADGGIATSTERGVDNYRVLSRISDTIVKVALK